MNNVKSAFSIKDLENLTGIKAHTIRIWEKRYNLLHPSRTDTNIRLYDLESLQKLLNISFLNENGHKISKIALMSKEKRSELVREIAIRGGSNNHALNLFKMSMLNFDQHLFKNTYDNISKEKSFREIFYDVFIPLLSDIGVLWQTDTITPSHENFVSTLIRQKITANTEKFQAEIRETSNDTYVLFLPDNEIHELGLMFLNLEIVSKGHHSILLGQSVPAKSLVDILNYYEKITFISYFTIKPEKEELDKYLEQFEEMLLKDRKTKFWILGRMTQYIDLEKLPKSIKTFQSINDLVKEL